MTASPRLQALRALRDLGVVRARVDAAGYADLWRGGLASVTPRDPDPMVDFRLTAGGLLEAAYLMGGTEMPAPVALVRVLKSGEPEFYLFGEGRLRFLIVDECAPGDRVFEITERAPIEQLAAIVPDDAPIGSTADPRHPALAAMILAQAEGRRHLRVVREAAE